MCHEWVVFLKLILIGIVVVIEYEQPSSVFVLREPIGDMDINLLIVKLVDRLWRQRSIGYVP
jgi:hypothetical protein